MNVFETESRLFALARKSRRLPHILLAVPLSAFFLYGALIAGAIIGSLLFAAFVERGPLVAEIVFELRNILSFGLAVALLVIWLHWYEGRKLWTLGLERRAPAVRSLLVGWVISVIMIGAVVGLAALTGGASVIANVTPLGGFTAVALLLLVLPSRIVQGGAEELIFRGWMLQVLGLRYRPWIGIIVTSIVFSLLHVANAGFLPLAILNITLIGIFLALYAIREGALWGVIALHAGLNWAQTNLFGLPASGHTVDSTLLVVHLTGNDLITGGAFGIENSVAMTLVVLVAVGFELVFAWRGRPNTH